MHDHSVPDWRKCTGSAAYEFEPKVSHAEIVFQDKVLYLARFTALTPLARRSFYPVAPSCSTLALFLLLLPLPFSQQTVYCPGGFDDAQTPYFQRRHRRCHQQECRQVKMHAGRFWFSCIGHSKAVRIGTAACNITVAFHLCP